MRYRGRAKEKEKYMNEICEEIDQELQRNNLDKAYGLVKKFFGDKRKASGIKDEHGQYLLEENEIAQRWKRYVDKLYGNEELTENLIENEEEVTTEMRAHIERRIRKSFKGDEREESTWSG